MTRLSKPTVVVLGTGRSGTTWLAGILARPFRYRLLFEPDHPEHVPGAHLIADQFVTPESCPEPVQDFIFRAFDDRIASDWISQDSTRRFGMNRWRFWPRLNIVKLVRSNLLVPAIRAIFDPCPPILILVRHPASVIESFLRVRFPWAFDIQTLLEQAQVEQRFGVPVGMLRDCAVSEVGRLAVRWVIENQFLLQHSKALGAELLFYEDLAADPEREVAALCARLKIEPAADLATAVRRPSHTTHPRSPIRRPGSGDRPPALDVRQMKTIDGVLKLAGIDYPREPRA